MTAAGNRRPPFCYICSTEDSPNVRHFHNSAREIRVMQGVDKTDRPFMCISCQQVHSVVPTEGFNVLIGTNNFHDLHTPRDSNTTRMDPDPLHVEWLTILNASIRELEHAWFCDYVNWRHPMRILLCAGLEDLLKGKSVTDIIESILHFQLTVSKQNAQNELVVGTLLNPPMCVWFPDNGRQPRNHRNLLTEIKELNSWIVKFNDQNGKITPRLHRFGVRDGWVKDENGRSTRVKRHIMSQWAEGPVTTKSLLAPRFRVRLGTAAVRHFLGERERHGILQQLKNT